MTVREKNFVLFFLEKANLDSKNLLLEKEIFKTLSKLIDALPNEYKREGLKLEGELVEHLFNVKWSYLEYGSHINEILENYDLNWEPNKEN